MSKAFIHGLYRGNQRSSVDSPQRRRRPTARAILLAFGMLALVAIFCALGFWQLDRAEQKRALQSQYDRRGEAPPVVLGSDVSAAQALQFFRIEARGSYDDDYPLLIDNRAHQGVPGYHAVTALRIDGGNTRVLVNRGWVPLGADRAHPPSIAPPRGTVTVQGVGVVPHAGFALGAPDPLHRDAPTVWQQLDLARYAQETGETLQPIVILLDPDSDAGGYVRDWVRLDAGIAVHQAYAFQWFMLAATVVGIGVWLLRSRLRRRDSA